ncbi:MAG: PD40 domain-containing protein [Anaerolineaceae bacterium]|nr:PD40 domain-containing protein [Anaerolineaceae bacterium]
MKLAIAFFCSFLSILSLTCLAESLVSPAATLPNPAMPTLSDIQREDTAYSVDIPMKGSLQNPAWSPDSDALLFTQFSDGYNLEPADLVVIDLASGGTRVLVSDGSGNVNLPGSSWNSLIGNIIFSSSREPHDEIYLIDAQGSPGNEHKITSRTKLAAYEASLSPDGKWIVFESHQVDEEDNGILLKYKIDGTKPYQNLTDPDEDCRQPNWSPAGSQILYQKFSHAQWDIWTMDSDGNHHQKVTSGSGDKTDASFSPDGQWIVYSSNQSGLEFANLFITSLTGDKLLRLTHYEGYDGAPSWSPDGKKIAFESYPDDPDDSSGTTLWMIDVPAPYQ